jgi:hypothetical protein
LTSIEGRLKDSSDLLGGRWRGVCRRGNIGHGGGMSSRGIRPAAVFGDALPAHSLVLVKDDAVDKSMAATVEMSF